MKRQEHEERHQEEEEKQQTTKREKKRGEEWCESVSECSMSMTEPLSRGSVLVSVFN